MIATRFQKRPISGFVLLLMVSYALFQCVYGAWSFDWTYDEPWHLMWNKSLVETGSTSRDLPGNFQSTTPILAPNIIFGKGLVKSKLLPQSRELFGQRVFNAVWVLTLVLSTYAVGHMLSGSKAALLAATAVALEPNLAAHSSIATVDLSFAAACMLTLAAYLFFLRGPGTFRAIALGAAMGLVLAAKFTGVLLPAAFVLTIPLMKIFSKRSRPGPIGMTVLLAISMVSALLVVCSFYRFNGVGAPFNTIGVYSAPFKWMTAHLPWLRLPLPLDFVTGVDQCLSKERDMTWNVIFLGRLWPHGTWRYFPVVWLLKTPVFLVILTLLGFALLICDPETRRRKEIRFLLFVLGLNLFYFMFIFQTQVGIRYVLFCLPIIYLIASCAIAESTARIPVKFLAAGFLSVLVEVLPYTGNLLAFSSVLVYPKTKASEYFADSNLDWGQNERKLQSLAQTQFPGVPVDPVHFLPGKNLIKVNMLSGVWFNYPQFRWVRENLTPSQSFEHTMLLYSVTDQQFQRMMKEERTLPAFPESLSDCLSVEQLTPLENITDLTWQPGARLCIEAKNQSTVRFKAIDNVLNLAPTTTWKGCQPVEEIKPNEEAWFDLAPGMHEFCINFPDEPKGEPKFRLELLQGSIVYGM